MNKESNESILGKLTSPLFFSSFCVCVGGGDVKDIKTKANKQPIYG
jgi:hypothetical protein